MGALTPITIQPGNTDKPGWEDYSQCVHCGLCLNACPTYRLFGNEADSPRGRIHQMILVEEGRLAVGDSFVQHMDLCLDCRACETACPAGVEYGKLIEGARARIESEYKRPVLSRMLRKLGLCFVIPFPGRLALLARLLRFYQRSGLQRMVRASGVLRLFGKLGKAESMLPLIEDSFFHSEIGKTFPAQGEQRARVAFFAGCMQRVTFAELNRATIRVLQANGCEVVVPAGQTCCGALHAHTGRRGTARELAMTNVLAFEDVQFDALITNTAGCGSALKEYIQMFPGDSHEHEAIVKFSTRVRDVTEFLVELGLRPPAGRVEINVTVQDSCHLIHAQKIRNAPRTLLASIPGLNLTEMRLADQCCGSAGVYNLTQPETAGALLEEKMAEAAATGAEAIVTANPGCVVQLRAGAEQHKTGQEVLHVVDILDRAYTNKS